MSKIKTALSFRKTTNHWLHFFITMLFLAFGLYTTELLPLLVYMFVWLILSAKESHNNQKIFREIELALAEGNVIVQEFKIERSQ